jgi:hypothetical protein
MKRVYAICTILALSLLAGAAHAQAACSYTSPCLSLAWTSSSMAAAVTTSPTTGGELTGPGIAVVGKSIGSTATATSTQAAAIKGFVTAYIANPALTTWSDPNSAWSFAVIPQVAPAGSYADQVVNGNLNNYLVFNVWTGENLAGVAPAVSPMLSTQIQSTPPQNCPVAPGSLSTSGVATTGTSTAPAIP